MVSPQRLGGVPTVSGTRVPFDLISDLTCGEDPMSAEEVADLYPSVDAQGVDAAIEFTKAVQGIAS